MLIRSILSHLHLEILKRTRPPSMTFNFQSASIGNMFLTGARLFSGSFEAAIYLLAIMGGVDEAKTAVLPAIISNFSHHISAGLQDGTVISGQNAISHPSEPTALNNDTLRVEDLPATDSSTNAGRSAPFEDATLPGAIPTLSQKTNISFSKDSSEEQPLPSPISRIWYINPYGQEMHPTPNPKVLDAVTTADAVIYSIGSLYTSIIPSLILGGVGAAITGKEKNQGGGGGGPRFKILILNGSLDRETGGYTAADFLDAITRACLESDMKSNSSTISRSSSKQHPSTTPIIAASSTSTDNIRDQWHQYTTHLIHLSNSNSSDSDSKTPFVDKHLLSQHGVECIRIYGTRKGEGGMMQYDPHALVQALGAILGTRGGGKGGGAGVGALGGEKSRRNTLEV